jgi:hypothetical protein
VILRGRFAVARRLPTLPAIARARGRGELFERSLETNAEGLVLDIFGSRTRRRPVSLLAPFIRFLAA